MAKAKEKISVKTSFTLTQTHYKSMKLNTFYRAAICKIGSPKILIRIMKLTTLLLIIAFVQASAASYGQKINLQEKNASLATVLQSIKAQTGYVFFSKDFDLDKPIINVNLKDASLEEALDACFKNLPIEYKVVDKTVFLTEKEASILDKIKTVLDIPIYITGTVLDEQNKPLPGVTIKIKNTNTATVTNEIGKYSISVPDKNTILIFSFIGYETQEINAGNIGNPPIIVMKVSLNNLKEVIINKGYYSETKELSTGDVTTITAKEIEQQPVSSPLAALIGRVPGLVITQTTGVPGGSFKVQIRGQNSIRSGTDPFYVIDGVPYFSQFSGQGNLGGLLNSNLNDGSPLNFLNSYDIERIDVLKDADATSLYGSRAANGAILITTKKGKAGTMKVDFNLSSGFTTPTRDLPLLNTKQYLTVRKEAFKNDGKLPGPADYDVNGDWDTTRYTNWSKTLTKNTAHYTDAEGSISGGNENTQYLAGFGYNRQTTGFPTLLPDDGADQKVSAHFNINSISPNKKFKFTISGNFLNDKNTVQSIDFSQARLNLAPDAPAIFNQDHTLNWMPLAPGQVGTWANPYANLYIQDKGVTFNLVGNSTLSYTLLKGLDFKLNLGYNNTRTDEIQTYPSTFYDPAYQVTSGAANFGNISNTGWIVEPQLNYTTHFGKSGLTILLGQTFNDNTSQNKNLAATGFISDALLENIQSASSITVNNSTSAEYKYNAIFGRINYNYDDKYLLNITARRDGSSRFGPGKQFGNFGSIGGAWILTKEKFIEDNLPFLSFGKLRGSYGTTGNDQISDYQFLDLYTVSSNPYQNIQSLYPQNLFNPDLAWEIDKKLEGGIELGFFKNRISIEANIYRNRTGNQLVTTPVSQVTGYPNILSNLPALVQNSGKELVINTQNILSKSFHWSTSFNISSNKNKLLSFPGLASSPYADYLVVGQPIGLLHLYKYAGVNPTTGVYQFIDHTGQLTSAPDQSSNIDKTVFLNTSPKFYGGLGNHISYKSISLDFFFQFVKQTGQNLFGAYNALPGRNNNIPTAFLDRWQKPGDVTTYEKFSQDYSSAAYRALSLAQQSSFAYSDASFIRLKTVSLTWDLPNGWKQKAHLYNCQIYINAQNLLTITNYNGLDPESQGIGLPPVRTMVLGFRITL